MNISEFRDILRKRGLKVTPQRIAVYEALADKKNHPDADTIYKTVIEKHPNISAGTVYKNLETLVDHGVIRKIKTETGKMRFDPIVDSHHHLYCNHSDRIADYSDDNLDHLLEEYFTGKEIPGFKITDIKLQIVGQFK